MEKESIPNTSNTESGKLLFHTNAIKTRIKLLTDEIETMSRLASNPYFPVMEPQVIHDECVATKNDDSKSDDPIELLSKLLEGPYLFESIVSGIKQIS